MTNSPESPALCTTVAEVAQAHDGSLGTAHAFIDAIAGAGSQVVKFQTHIADAESHPSEPWRVQFSTQDDSRYDYWRRMEFSEAQWRALYSHAASVGLQFSSSPFSLDAVELLQRTGIDQWKIASGELANVPMLHAIASDGRPVVLSTGMSGFEELDAAVELLGSHGSKLTILQCTTAYPCPPERIGLNVMETLRSRYQCDVGLSDHSGTVFGSLAAAALGASMVEVHVTFSRQAFGPDVPASLTFEELRTLNEGLEFISRALSSPVDKEAAAGGMADLKRLFGRSAVTRRPIERGQLVADADFVLKKPGGGLTYDQIQGALGRRFARDLPANHFLEWNDIESD